MVNLWCCPAEKLRKQERRHRGQDRWAGCAVPPALTPLSCVPSPPAQEDCACLRCRERGTPCWPFKPSDHSNAGTSFHTSVVKASHVASGPCGGWDTAAHLQLPGHSRWRAGRRRGLQGLEAQGGRRAGYSEWCQEFVQEEACSDPVFQGASHGCGGLLSPGRASWGAHRGCSLLGL